MQTPVGTVMSRLFRGRKLLAAALREFALAEGYVSRRREARQDREADRQRPTKHDRPREVPRREARARGFAMSLCQSIDTLAMAYLDDELAAEERRELELHLLDVRDVQAPRRERTRRARAWCARRSSPPPAPDAAEGADRARARRRGPRERRAPSAAPLVAAGSCPARRSLAAAAAIARVRRVGRPPAERRVERRARRAGGRARSRRARCRSRSRARAPGRGCAQHFAPGRAAAVHRAGHPAARRAAHGGGRATTPRCCGTSSRSGSNRFTLTAVRHRRPPRRRAAGGARRSRSATACSTSTTRTACPAVTYVDENRIGYMFASERLSPQELLELVVSSDLIGRAQQRNSSPLEVGYHRRRGA